MNIAFTICSNNYLAKAKVVAETFINYHNDYQFYIFLVDKLNSALDYSDFSKFQIIEVADIIVNIDELAIKYNIIELNTAIKPAAFLHLFKKCNGAMVIYLDPDTMVFDRFDEVEEILNVGGANIVVTPHFCSPIDDGKYPSEIDFTLFGLYNLGFIAIMNSSEADKFLLWWHDRLMKYCYIQTDKGMFTDQLWVNYAPIFFKGVYILKHLGYNVANWNLYERVITNTNSLYHINGDYKLKFFHFSHYQFNNPYLISKSQNRFTINERFDVKGLIDNYQNKLVNNDYVTFASAPCYYHELYLNRQRELYLKNLTFKRRVKNKLTNYLNKLISD